jgi:hypothetical protein
VVSVALALTRLQERQTALLAERQRLVSTHDDELAHIDDQLAAVKQVLGGLSVKTNAALVDSLLTSLEQAGVGIEIAG